VTDAEDIGLLATAAMRARRHPAAIAGLWAWETILAILVAWPARSLAGAAYGGNPSGDAALWSPGGRWLLDFVTRDYHGVRAILGGAGVVLLAGFVAGLVPLGALLSAIAYASRDKRAVGFAWSLQQGVRFFPALVLQLVLVGVLQGVVVGLGVGIASLARSAAQVPMGEARAQQMQLVILGAFVLVAAIFGIGRDLCSAAVIRSLASLAPLAVGAWVADRLGGRGGTPLFVLLVIHQSVVGSRVAFRASWLARALRAVDGALVRRA
jgi:hypothetical protein